ncbi:MAG: hypothetical protein EPO01_08415 [Aquabacterium sp.]|jgi:ornithine carbamoyltransferase|nr:MAG: hypothetical protein EPO12_02825 [Aquabacterium sp.]TAL22777.1 MAG: hypothetical protein EPO01_08415 [Aquabacterium sp.]
MRRSLLPDADVNFYLDFRDLWSADRLPAALAGEVLRAAVDLRRAKADPATQRLLQGRNIALLCEEVDGSEEEDARLFSQAASSLGARVARVRPAEAGLLPGRDLRELARMLGRLYDAIECEGMDEGVVGQLAEHSGVPVFNGIGRRSHPTAAWAVRLDGRAPGEAGDAREDREALIQSLLVGTLR